MNERDEYQFFVQFFSINVKLISFQLTRSKFVHDARNNGGIIHQMLITPNEYLKYLEYFFYIKFVNLNEHSCFSYFLSQKVCNEIVCEFVFRSLHQIYIIRENFKVSLNRTIRRDSPIVSNDVITKKSEEILFRTFHSFECYENRM